MTGPVFVLVTDADSLMDVAVNVAAIEVIEAKADDETFICCGQHTVSVRMPLAEVFELLQRAATGGAS